LLEDGITGSVVQSGDCIQQVVDAIDFWMKLGRGRVKVSDERLGELSIERNSAETLNVVTGFKLWS
jgi:hypothetical protein